MRLAVLLLLALLSGAAARAADTPPQPPSAAPPIAVKVESQPKGTIEQVYDATTKVVSIALNVLLGLVLLGALYLAVWETRRRSIVIEPIEVPKDLAERGCSPNVVAIALAGEIAALQRAARVTVGIEEGFELSASQIDFNVPTAGISYRAIIRYVRQFLGKPEERIRGEIRTSRTGASGPLRLTLRTSDGRTTPNDLSASSADAFPDLLRRAALEIAALVDPYLTASYWFEQELAGREFERTLEAVHRCFERSPPPQHHRAYVIWANVLRTQRRFDEAEEKLRLALRINPRSAQAYNTWGILHRTRRRLDDAAIAYRRATRLNRAHHHAWANLGQVCNDRRDYAAAVRCFRRALRLKPDHAGAWTGLGYAQWKTGLDEEAEASFARSIDVDPQYGWAYLNRARLLLERRRHDAAIDTLKAALRQPSVHAEIYALWGDVLVALERYDEADALYERSLAADATLGNGYAGKGHALLERGRPDEAEPWLRRALAANPWHTGASANLLRALRDQGRWDDLEAACAAAVREDRYQLWALVQWGNAHAARHRLRDAETLYRQAAALDPHDSWPWQQWAWLLLDRLHAHEAAMEKFGVALRRAHWNPWAHLGLGRALLAAGRVEEALACALTARNLAPSLPWALSRVAEALIALGRRDEALSEVRQALATQPETPELVIAASRVLRDLGRADEPLDALERLKAADPLDARILRELGQVRRELRDAAEGERLLAEAARLRPWDDACAADLAWALYVRHGLAAARQCLEDAMPAVPFSLMLPMTYGSLLRSAANLETSDSQKSALRETAASWYRRARTIDPHATWPLRALGDLACDEKNFAHATVQYQAALAADRHDRAAILGLARIALREERWEAAKDLLDRALAYRPGDAERLIERGRCFWALGEKRRAREDFRRAADIDPADDEAPAWLARTFEPTEAVIRTVPVTTKSKTRGGV